MHRTKKLIGVLLTIALMLTVSACSTAKPAETKPAAEAQKAAEPAKPKWPTKAVTIIAHTSPGGGMDVFLREVAPLLQKELGQPVVIENRSGGSGATAMQYVASQPADGYTLLGLTDTLIISPIQNTTPKSIKDFTGIAMTVVDPILFFVKTDSKWKSAKELLDAAKSGTRITVAVSQAGSPERMALDALINKHGMKGFVPVPNDGGGEGLKQVLGGQVEVSMAEPAESMAQIKAGTIRALAVFNSKRMPGLPEVPTVDELGYTVAIDKFRGFVAPKGAPEEAIKGMEAAVKRMMETPEYKAVYEKNFQIPMFQGADDFNKFLAGKEAKYREALGK